MTEHKAFLDSNVVLYALSADATKAARSEALLKTRPTISVQVLNEVADVCIRKHRMAWNDVSEFLDSVCGLCEVVPLTLESHDLARQIAMRFGVSVYDASILASASLAGCHTAYSEDMHHGLCIGKQLVIRDPFRPCSA